MDRREEDSQGKCEEMPSDSEALQSGFSIGMQRSSCRLAIGWIGKCLIISDIGHIIVHKLINNWQSILSGSSVELLSSKVHSYGTCLSSEYAPIGLVLV